LGRRRPASETGNSHQAARTVARRCAQSGQRDVRFTPNSVISYGPNVPDQFRRAAEIVDKVLRGTKPGDIPVEEPTKYELVINLQAAKRLGLVVPYSMQLLADKVIEQFEFCCDALGLVLAQSRHPDRVGECLLSGE
jgi:hypothetical protein